MKRVLGEHGKTGWRRADEGDARASPFGSAIDAVSSSVMIFLLQFPSPLGDGASSTLLPATSASSSTSCSHARLDTAARYRTVRLAPFATNRVASGRVSALLVRFPRRQAFERCSPQPVFSEHCTGLDEELRAVAAAFASLATRDSREGLAERTRFAAPSARTWHRLAF